MTAARCVHCGSALDDAFAVCSSCGRPYDRAVQLSEPERQALFAEIERVAEERGWYEEEAVREVRVFNEAWVIVPLAAAVVFGGLLEFASVGFRGLVDFPADLWRMVRGESEATRMVFSSSIVAAIVGFFIGMRRSKVVEVDEPLVDYLPAIALEKSRVRFFPLLPERPTVVLELANGEQVAYGSVKACFEQVVPGQAGLALIARNQLVRFLALDS